MTSIIQANSITGIAVTGDNSGTLELQASNSVVTLANNTGALTLPTGNTAQRPGTATNGTMRYNTSNNVIEVYLSGSWANVAYN